MVAIIMVIFIGIKTNAELYFSVDLYFVIT